MSKGLLSVREGAEYLGLGRSKFLELVYAGTIRSFVVGRRRLVPLAECDRFIEKRLDEAGGR